MHPVECALLFVSKPKLALEQFGETLNQRLAFLNQEFEKTGDEPGISARFANSGMELEVIAVADALPADSFRGAITSPLSQAHRGVLADTLFRHNRYILMRLSAIEGPDQPDRLTMLRVAHAATTLLTEWHLPAALHWRQSNQLLVGSQYLELARDDTPWALFAHAQINKDSADDLDRSRHSLLLDEATEFIGRPIHFKSTDWPPEEMHASALSFLRHAVDNGGPIPDGDSFGLGTDHVVRVAHIEAAEDTPEGLFELTAVERPEHGFVSMRPSAVAKRSNEVAVEPVAPYVAEPEIEEIDPAERTRSLAVSYMMLVIVPPIGVLLLVTNALFGVNAWRTSVIATASVALALIVGAYSFLNYVGQETAVFIDPEPVVQTVLQD